MSEPRDDIDVFIARLVGKGIGVYQISLKTGKSQLAVEHRCNVMGLPFSGEANKGESADTKYFLSRYFWGYIFPKGNGYPMLNPCITLKEALRARRKAKIFHAKKQR